jgi:16S rRNA (adenine1518-N6/adenine1519-N6)-dimethyltransferase
MEIPLTPKEIKNAFLKIGGNAKKSWGQNFFINEELLRKIIYSVPLKEEPELILEIGPGFGAMSIFLLERWSKGLSTFAFIERDPLLASFLQEALNTIIQDRFKGKIRTFHFNCDILKPSPEFLEFLSNLKKTFLQGQISRVLCTGSLPYYISSPILEWFVSRSFFKYGLFMLQRDLVERIQMEKGSRLGHWLRLHGKITLIRHIKPENFFPIPQVESSIFLFERDYSQVNQILASLPGALPASAGLVNKYLEIFEFILKMIFWGRRKTILSALIKNPYQSLEREIAGELLKLAGIKNTARAEELGENELLQLAFHWLVRFPGN